MKTNKLSRFTSYGIEDDSEVESPVAAMTDEELNEELAEKETGADTVVSDVSEMEDVADSLEAICVGIRSTLQRGGLNRQAAAFALQSADLQLARLGLEGIKVAVEDFEEAPATDPVAEDTLSADGGSKITDDNNVVAEPDTTSVSENVAVSQEADKTLGEKIKAIWDAIVNAIKAFFGKLRDWFMAAWDGLRRGAKKIGGYIASLASIPANAFKNMRVRSRLKKMIGTNEIKKSHETVKTYCKKNEAMLKDIESILNDVYKMILSKDEAEQQKGLDEYQKLVAMIDEDMKKAEATVSVGGETMDLATGQAASQEAEEGAAEGVVIDSKEEVVAVAKETEAAAKDESLKAVEKSAEGIFEKIKNGCGKFVNSLTAAASWLGTNTMNGARAIARWVSKIGMMIFNGIRKAVGWILKVIGWGIAIVAGAVASAGMAVGVGGAVVGGAVAAGGRKVAGA